VYFQKIYTKPVNSYGLVNQYIYEKCQLCHFKYLHLYFECSLLGELTLWGKI